MPYRSEHLGTITVGTKTLTIEQTVHISGSSGRESEPYFSLIGTDSADSTHLYLPPQADTVRDMLHYINVFFTKEV